MADQLEQHYALTLLVPEGMEFHEAQERVLQSFPENVDGIEIGFVRITSGLVDADSVPVGPQPVKEGK